MDTDTHTHSPVTPLDREAVTSARTSSIEDEMRCSNAVTDAATRTDSLLSRTAAAVVVVEPSASTGLAIAAVAARGSIGLPGRLPKVRDSFSGTFREATTGLTAISTTVCAATAAASLKYSAVRPNESNQSFYTRTLQVWTAPNDDAMLLGSLPQRRWPSATPSGHTPD